MGQECPTTGPDTARSTCPSWCVEDHEDYTAQKFQLGDLITHLGDEEAASGWSIWPDGEEEAQSFTLQQYRHVHPDGRIEAEGIYFADTALPADAALEVLEKLLAECRAIVERAAQ